MQVVTKSEAVSNLAKLLDSVAAGEEFVIAQNDRPVARLIPAASKFAGTRPKVGQTISAPMKVPESALAPLSPDELKTWGL
jgi:prevent-host-death family protein